MKVNTIFYLKSVLEKEQRKLHDDFIKSVNFCFSPDGKLNVKQKEYSKINEVLYLGYTQEHANFSEMIKELNELLPKP